MIPGLRYIGTIASPTAVALGSGQTLGGITAAEARELANVSAGASKPGVRVLIIVNKIAAANGLPALSDLDDLPDDVIAAVIQTMAKHGFRVTEAGFVAESESNAKWWIGGGLLLAAVIGIGYAMTRKNKRGRR